jgi:hypothetical protein
MKTLLAASAIALLSWAGGAVAETCETPMPAGLQIDPVAAAPAEDAGFLGMWAGRLQAEGTLPVCYRVAVQHIDVNGVVKLTVAHEEFLSPNGRIPANAQETLGWFENGQLHFISQLGTRYVVAADGTVTSTGVTGATASGHFSKQ